MMILNSSRSSKSEYCDANELERRSKRHIASAIEQLSYRLWKETDSGLTVLSASGNSF